MPVVQLAHRLRLLLSIGWPNNQTTTASDEEEQMADFKNYRVELVTDIHLDSVLHFNIEVSSV